MSRLTLIRLSPRSPATGAAEAVRFAGGGTRPYHHDGLHYRAGLLKEPRFAGALAFGADGWRGGGVPTVTAINFTPADPAMLDQLHQLYWPDAAIEMDSVDEADGVTRVLTGTVASAIEQDGVLAITAADLSKALSKPLAADTFAGAGGIEGDQIATGRIKRRSWGRVFNVEGRLLNAAFNIYEFGDPARPLQGCTALRDKGREGYLDILGWQGSIAATFDTLKAATVPQGGGVFAPSIACAKWWTEPAGPLTADLLGEIGTGYVETVAEIAAAVSTALDGPAISNLAAAVALRGAAAGWHVGDASTTGAAVLDQMLAGAGLLWVLEPAGTIRIGEWTWTGPAEPVRGIWQGRDAQYAPHRSRKLGYRKNERRHGDGEIATDILAADVVTGSGESLSAFLSEMETRVDAKRTIFVQPTAPSAAESEENDWWQQTTADRSQVIATYRRVAGSGLWGLGGDTWAIGGDHLEMAWTPVEDQRIGDALQAATDASNLADSKAVVFTMYSAGDPVPVGTDIGDMLVRAYLSPVQVDYWNGTSWAAAATFGATAAQVANITQALTDAANAQATADGKIDSFYQASAPSGGSLGDLWFDTDDGNKQYRHNGSSWVAVQDAGIGSAITAAAGAQATADGKVTTFVGESTPTAEGDGDLWYKASSQTLSRWNGSAWVVVSSLGAPAGTNVGSTPSTTVESGANAGGAAANPDGTIKDNKVNTPAVAANAITGVYYGTWTPIEAAYVIVNPAPGGVTNWGPTIQYLAFTKTRDDSDLIILCEYVLRSTNDIIAKVRACLYTSTDTGGTPFWTGFEGMGQGMLLDGSARSIAAMHKLNIASGLPAGTYYLRMQMAGASGLPDYPSGGGTQTGMLQNAMVQEVKR